MGYVALVGLILVAVGVVGFVLEYTHGIDWFPFSLLAVCVGIIVVVVAIVMAIATSAEQNMSECMADGKKRYECIGILHGGHR